MTKHLLRNSSGLQAVLCINNNSVICPIRYPYTNHYSQSKFWVQDFTKTCGWTTNTKWSFFMQFISDLSKDITRLAQQEPFLMVTRLHIPAWFLFSWHNSSPKSHTICFFLAHCQNPCHEFLFIWGKKEKVKVTLIEYFNDCLFTETSTVPAQAD